MVWRITGAGSTGLDADAAAYIASVEAADGQALEAGVRWNINQFVRGCKADGIWTAIKACCVMAGARTLAGALKPLVGTAPTNNNFVSGDYDRKYGLLGNGSSKYIDSNRNNNADPQNSKHIAIYITQATTVFNFGRLIAAGDSTQGDSGIVTNIGALSPLPFSINNSGSSNISTSATTGLFGASRGSSTAFTARAAQTNTSVSLTSTTPRNENIRVFGRPEDGRYVNARIAFYSVGENLDLALLDARITTLINSNASVIP